MEKEFFFLFFGGGELDLRELFNQVLVLDDEFDFVEGEFFSFLVSEI